MRLRAPLTTSSAYMAVQGTGAMAILVADVPDVHNSDGSARALFTLAMVTGVVMAVAGLLRLGSVLRFVSNAVMVGFINGVWSEHRAGAAWPTPTGYSSPRNAD